MNPDYSKRRRSSFDLDHASKKTRTSNGQNLDQYTIGIICSLPFEVFTAVVSMLDEEHPGVVQQNEFDHNIYALGTLAEHHVVIASRPRDQSRAYSATSVAKDMLETFKCLRLGFFVGIAGGPPSHQHQIRLGDVVISQPYHTYSAFQTLKDGYTTSKSHLEVGSAIVESTCLPPGILLEALQVWWAKKPDQEKVHKYIQEMIQKNPKTSPNLTSQGSGNDNVQGFEALGRGSYNESSDQCSFPPKGDSPKIFPGPIVSSDLVIDSGEVRNYLLERLGAQCFETEAAGLQGFPSLVIRGIYEHTGEQSIQNEYWRKYSAATSAAVTKELLLHITPEQVRMQKPIIQVPDPVRQQQEQIEVQHEFRLGQQKEELVELEETDEIESENPQKCLEYFEVCPYAYYKDLNPDREEGTCLWVLNNSRFSEWKSGGKDDLIWISAHPGCGKSVLARFLIEDELPKQKSGRHTICYFFFKENDVQNNLSTALCSILHQLFEKKPNLIHHALKHWMKPNLKTKVHELWDILMHAATDNQAGNVTIVLDALDECRPSERKLLIGFLNKFYERPFDEDRRSQLKILVTSRPSSDIQADFGSIPAELQTIRIPGENEDIAIQKEIDLVIRSELPARLRNFCFRDSVKAPVVQKLLSMRPRTYLWLEFVFEHVYESFYRAIDVPSIVRSIPQTIETLYGGMLHRSNNRHETKLLLQIVLGAKRPLEMDEVAVVLNLALPPTYDSRSHRVQLYAWTAGSLIKDHCGTFVSLCHDKVSLNHKTARSFLRSQATIWSIQQQDSERLWAKLCMQILLSGSTTLSGVPTTALFKYAAQNWHLHFKEAGVDPNDALIPLGLSMYAIKNLLSWMEAGSYSIPRDKTGLPLIIASQNGHDSVVPRLIHMDMEDRKRRAERGQAENGQELVAAAENGHFSTVQLLLEIGKSSEGKQLAIEAASRAGHEAIVNLLLDRLPYQSEHLGKALKNAARYDYVLIARALLENRVSAKAGATDALHIAAIHGHNATAQVLLDHGANINDDEGMPLHLACENGHVSTVKLLLDRGANLALAQKDAFMAASRMGHKEVVRYLLGHKTPTKRGNTDAMIIAAQNNHLGVTRLLLDDGADASGKNSMALVHACTNGNEAMVRLLLEHGADANCQNGEAISQARAKGHVTIVSLLLHHR